MKIETFRSDDKLYRFRLKGANGKIIAASQGYKRKRSRDKAIALLQRCAGVPVVEGKA